MSEYPTPPGDPILLDPAAVPAVRRRRALRWLAPVAAVGVVALIGSGVLSAGASTNLAPRTAAQLLAAVGDAKVAGFSGTVVSKTSLGLPELPDLGGGNTGTSPLSLLTGSHTARVWYAGESKQRVALIGSLSEQDVFRNGRDLWQWDSTNPHSYTHTTLPAEAAQAQTRLPVITPDEAARQALAFIDPSTNVSTDHSAIVAGRAAYVLILTPKTAASEPQSRVGMVRISIDGKTNVPLRVQVLPRGSDKAAIDVFFTRFDDSVPANENFVYRPPAGVTQAPANPSTGRADTGTDPRLPAPGTSATGPGSVKMIGSGWTTVAEVTGVPSLSSIGSQDPQVGRLVAGLTTVSGSWGTGKLFSSALLTALFTSDGRVFVGAVDPAVLTAAAAR